MIKTQTQHSEVSATEGDAELLSDETTEWVPPTSSEVGWRDLIAAEIRKATFADADPFCLAHAGT